MKSPGWVLQSRLGRVLVLDYPPMPQLYPPLCLTMKDTLAACLWKANHDMIAGLSSFHVRRQSLDGESRRLSSKETCCRIPLKRSSFLAQMTHVFDDKEAMDAEWGISSSEHPEPSPKANTT